MQRNNADKGVTPVEMTTDGVVVATPATESTSWFASCLSLFCLPKMKDSEPKIIDVNNLEATYPHGGKQPGYWD